MANNDNEPKKLASTYADFFGDNNNSDFDESIAADAARALSRFGQEGFAYIIRKLSAAEPSELRNLLHVVRHMDHPDIGAGLENIVVNRVVPLDLKVDAFHVMADLGFSVDNAFLKHLHEAEELYLQLNSHLKSEDEEGIKRLLSHSDEFLQLPTKLKLSFLQELTLEWEDKSMVFLNHIAGQDPEIDPNLIDIFIQYPSKGSLESLIKLTEEASDKDIQKKAKRALYILKEKGIEIEKPKAAEETVIVRGEQDDSDQAFATTFDSFGTRLLVLATPALSRILVGRASIDDVNGLLRFSSAEMSRKHYREFLKELKEQVKNQGISTLVRINPDYCRWLMQRSFMLNNESGYLVPEGFKRIRYRIKPPGKFDGEAFLTQQLNSNKSEIDSNSRGAEDLFEIKELAIWMLDKEQLLPYTKRYVEMAESKLVLDENQRKERLNDVINDFAVEYFDETRLTKLVNRIQETSYMLIACDRKLEAKRLALLVEELKESTALNLHPFLNLFMLRSIISTIQVFSKDEAPAENEQDGLIIKPD